MRFDSSLGRGMLPSVLVTVVPLVIGPLFGQPLYYLFLYYAIEIFVMAIIGVVFSIFAQQSSEEGTESSEEDESSRNQSLLPPIQWSNLRTTFPYGVLFILQAYVASILIWAPGLGISRLVTGEPAEPSLFWIDYVPELPLHLLGPALVLIVIGNVEMIYRELIFSGKYQHSTPWDVIKIYYGLSMFVPLVFWFIIILICAPVAVIIAALAYILEVEVIRLGTIGLLLYFSGPLFGIGLYVGLRSYIDWRRVTVRRAWKNGAYDEPLIPKKEYDLSILGGIQIRLKE